MSTLGLLNVNFISVKVSFTSVNVNFGKLYIDIAVNCIIPWCAVEFVYNEYLMKRGADRDFRTEEDVDLQQ